MKHAEIQQLAQMVLNNAKQAKLTELHEKTACIRDDAPAGLTPYSKALLKVASAIREIKNGEQITTQDMEWFVSLADNAIRNRN